MNDRKNNLDSPVTLKFRFSILRGWVCWFSVLSLMLSNTGFVSGQPADANQESAVESSQTDPVEAAAPGNANSVSESSPANKSTNASQVDTNGGGEEREEAKAANKTPSIELPPVVDVFTAGITDHDLDDSDKRAWEYRPYRVAVWICSDGSPELNSLYSDLVQNVTSRSELIDPSGWDLSVGLPPSQWRWKFMNSIESPELIGGFTELPMLASFDKLMVVCLNAGDGLTNIRVREFDMQTQQWGPLLNKSTGHKHQLASSIMDLIKLAFMPLAQIERVTEIDKKDAVYLQKRAVEACYRTVMNSDLQWEVVPIEGSPVYVRDDDRFLPIIRRTDRKGDLVKLERIDFTFLTINENKDSQVICSIQSYHRAPLSGRKSKRSQKLALVIRPPNQPTVLHLQSRGKDPIALEGFEIWARQPGLSTDVASDFIGKTDWKGEIEIPPTAEGLRLIYVKRGNRALKKLPIIPGLHTDLTTTVPNDETSLFAEGVLLRLQNEILNLVVQREVYEADMEDAIKEKNLANAKEYLKEYQKLESPSEVRNRMADEEIRLKALTADKREIDYIINQFNYLRMLFNKKLTQSKGIELERQIQDMSGL